MNKKLVFGVIALIAIIIVGAIIYGYAMREIAPADTAVAADDLNGKAFIITSLDGIPTPVGQEYIVEFANGAVSARICNSLFGDFNIANNIIRATLASTLMFCEEPAGMMDIEFAVSTFLQEGAAIDLSNGTLTLSKDDRDLVLTEVQTQ